MVIISIFHACNNFWNFLFSILNLRNFSGNSIISFFSSGYNSYKGFIASNLSFLYLTAFKSKSSMLSCSLLPNSFLLSIQRTIYKTSFSPNFIRSKVKLNLYSFE